ncbi:Spy/CpxP family protein refolding chaperone [Telmatobacter bradus]|uniref:Spy/CpxP family protein refolding chaperone n=1 Tax=Telmatobacter bradus TaxID=474953 RepID=UPI003B42C255
MKKKTFVAWLLMATAGAYFTGVAVAQGPAAEPGAGFGQGFGAHRAPIERALGPDGSHGRWWNNPAIVEKLKLSDEQRKAMDGILLEHREKLIDLRGNVEKAELEMEPLIKADQPNEGKILAQIDKLAAVRAELEKANARFLLALRAKLTPEQWKQLEDLRASAPHLHKWGEHRPEDRLSPAGEPKGAPAPEGTSGPGDE